MKKIIKWYEKLKKTNVSKVKTIPMSNLKNWRINSNKIFNKLNPFFDIIGIEISNSFNREIIKWYQPIIKEKNLTSGILGMLYKVKNGEKFFLIQGKFEPGNVNEVQISPTVQCTYSNIRLNKRNIPYLNFFISPKYKKKIKIKKKVSEDGGRFFKKANLVMIIKLNDTDLKNIKILNNYIWVKENNLIKLNHYKKPIVNSHVRTIISLIV